MLRISEGNHSICSSLLVSHLLNAIMKWLQVRSIWIACILIRVKKKHKTYDTNISKTCKTISRELQLNEHKSKFKIAMWIKMRKEFSEPVALTTGWFAYIKQKQQTTEQELTLLLYIRQWVPFWLPSQRNSITSPGWRKSPCLRLWGKLNHNSLSFSLTQVCRSL